MVNVQSLVANKLEGLGSFTYETLKRITSAHKEHRFLFVFDRKPDAEFIFSDNIEPHILYPPSRHPFLWYWRFEHLFPRFIARHKPDLFFSTDGWMPLNTQVPIVNTIHDLCFEHFPNDLPFWVRTYYRYFFPKFAKRADRIATVSQYSKNDLVNTYGVNPDKIDIVYDGCNEMYGTCNDLEKESVRKKYCQGRPYFVFVGAQHPRKNIANLFQAFDRFRKKADSSVKLLMVGKKRRWTPQIDKVYQEMSYKNDVVFTGWVPSAELRAILASALAMVYISYFEGFGIPILEGFYAQIPVITSNVTSMPEVSGDAALLVDPFSIESIAAALHLVASDEKLRQLLVQKGNLRKQEFSWDKTSHLLWRCLENFVQ